MAESTEAQADRSEGRIGPMLERERHDIEHARECYECGEAQSDGESDERPGANRSVDGSVVGRDRVMPEGRPATVQADEMSWNSDDEKHSGEHQIGFTPTESVQQQRGHRSEYRAGQPGGQGEDHQCANTVRSPPPGQCRERRRIQNRRHSDAGNEPSRAEHHQAL
ncbi:hypothetical protein BJF84_11865 [Rhodococcus sp. CUA-806]|nr:hypothetical protein BJF84_11865 [Rhodococcus sp. CUA-806]